MIFSEVPTLSLSKGRESLLLPNLEIDNTELAAEGGCAPPHFKGIGFLHRKERGCGIAQKLYRHRNGLNNVAENIVALIGFLERGRIAGIDHNTVRKDWDH